LIKKFRGQKIFSFSQNRKKKKGLQQKLFSGVHFFFPLAKIKFLPFSKYIFYKK